MKANQALRHRQSGENRSRSKRSRPSRALPRAKYARDVNVDDLCTLRCYVLADGTRLWSLSEVGTVLGVPYDPTCDEHTPGDGLLAAKALRASAFEPFVNATVKTRFIPPDGGKAIVGVPAGFLMDICDLWFAAEQDGELTSFRQLMKAQTAQALTSSLARVGEMALIAEATNG